MEKRKTEKAGITLHDERMKQLLMVREILAYVASQVVDDFRGMGWKEVLPYLEDPSTGGIGRGDRESTDPTGTVRYDVLVRLRSPRKPGGRIAVILNIEGQNGAYPAGRLRKRMLYYPCRLISAQKGDVFQGDAYGDLAQVVSVWLILKPAERDQGRTVEWTLESRQLTDMDEGGTAWKGRLEGLKVVSVCVPDLEHVQSEDMAGLLGVYLSGELCGREKCERLEAGWHVALPAVAQEVVAMFEGAGRDLWDKAEKAGRLETLAKNVVTLSRKLQVSPEKALELLDIQVSDQQEVLALIAKMQDAGR